MVLHGDNYRIGRRGEVFEYVGNQMRRRSDNNFFEFLPNGDIRNVTTNAVLAVGSPAHEDIFCTAYATDGQPVRLPPGRWRDHEVEILTKTRVVRVTLAGSTEELKAV